MNTKAPVLMVLVLAASGAMLSGSGFADAWGAEAPSTSEAQKALDRSQEVDAVSNTSAGDKENESGIKGPVGGGGESGSVLGLILSSAGALATMIGAIVVFPITLMNLGFPAWFAVPIGALAEVIVGIGLMQFTSGREWI